VELIDQSQPAKVAIDAPFGWPVPFVDAIASYAATGEWPTDEIAPLRLRETDRAVIAATRQQPLSVSADRIAVTAMRCARLLTRLRGAGHTITRDGRAGLAAEVYPAAALRVWRLDPRGYKGRKPEAVAKRQALVADLLAACAGWLDAEDHHERLVTSDHHLDALICAVLARVILCGHSAPVPVESEHSAVLEGWIHLPRESALDELAAAASV
jgi:hypothetical protein